jgi:hypothetical protein
MLSKQDKSAALSRMLNRCSRPACRARKRLRFFPLTTDRQRLRGEHVVVLCSDCFVRARAGEFSAPRLQRWRLRGRDYWENVGAE